MDGIFGVGLAEMAIIALVLFVVGGPQNAAKWAREAGRQVRKLRQAWDSMMADVERELGPDGQELMDATRELNRSARDFRSMSSPTRLMSEAARRIEDAVNEDTKPDRPDPGAAPERGKYRAWTPPDDQ